MAKLLGEALKIDSVIPGTILAPAAQAISAFYPLGRERKALFAIDYLGTTFDELDVLDVGIVDDSCVAPAASGALAALVAAADPGVLAFQTMTAGVDATEMEITLTGTNDGILTINGVAFPYDAAPAAGTGEWDVAANLVIEIATLLPEITAVAALEVITLTSTIPGETTITVTETCTAIIAADTLTFRQVAYLEVDADELVPGATTIAVVIDNPVANTGTLTASATLVRGNGRYEPVPQAVTVA